MRKIFVKESLVIKEKWSNIPYRSESKYFNVNLVNLRRRK